MTLFQEHLLQETDRILMEHDPDINAIVDLSLKESIKECLSGVYRDERRSIKS